MSNISYEIEGDVVSAIEESDKGLWRMAQVSLSDYPSEEVAKAAASERLTNSNQP